MEEPADLTDQMWVGETGVFQDDVRLLAQERLSVQVN